MVWHDKNHQCIIPSLGEHGVKFHPGIHAACLQQRLDVGEFQPWWHPCDNVPELSQNRADASASVRFRPTSDTFAELTFDRNQEYPFSFYYPQSRAMWSHVGEARCQAAVGSETGSLPADDRRQDPRIAFAVAARGTRTHRSIDLQLETATSCTAYWNVHSRPSRGGNMT